MTEIEKMFKNAGIKKAPDINNCYPEMMKCHHCKHYKVINEYTGRCLNEVYPDFTAEKQLELIKKLGNIDIDIDNGCYMSSDILKVEAHCDTFEETLAEFVNNLWQDLTESEQEQIRRILNE